MVSRCDDFPPDQVVRRHQFQAAHPEWRIISPAEPRSVLTGELCWRAIGPGGAELRERELRDLLDQAEKLSGP